MNLYSFFVALVLPVPSPDVNQMKENTLVVYDHVSDLFVVEYRKIILNNSKRSKYVMFIKKKSSKLLPKNLILNHLF